MQDLGKGIMNLLNPYFFISLASLVIHQAAILNAVDNSKRVKQPQVLHRLYCSPYYQEPMIYFFCVTFLIYPPNLEYLMKCNWHHTQRWVGKYVHSIPFNVSNDGILMNNIQYGTESLLTQFDYGNGL